MKHVPPFVRAIAILLLLVSGSQRAAVHARPDSGSAKQSNISQLANEAPIAADDSVDVRYNATNTIVHVLDNDYDPDGDALTIISVNTYPGTAVISGSVIIHTPGRDEWHTNGISYAISDGRGGIAWGEVTVSMTDIYATPQPDYYRVPKNCVDCRLSIMSNDTAPEIYHRINIGRVGPPRYGTAVIGYGEYGAVDAIYTAPTDFTGTDTFRYWLVESGPFSAEVGITVADEGENGAPIALDDTFDVTINSSATSLALLANDRDLDGDAFSVSAIGPAQHGTLANLGSSVAYTPTANFAGTDSFTYTVSDAGGLSATALVSLTVGLPTTPWPGFRQLPGSLPVAGQYYSATLVADDADADDMLEFSAENLPPGLSLVDHGDRTATLGGLPTQAGIYTPTLSISDPHMTTSVALPLRVEPALITITSPPPAPASYGTAYSHTLTAVGADPTAAVTFTVTMGALPPGLSLELDGVLSGTPTAAGSYAAIGLTAHSAAGSYTQLITLAIARAPLTITANNLTRPLAQPNPPLTAQFSGFVLGNDASALSSPLILSTPATLASPVGNYAITPGGATADNYAITFVPGTLTVTNATLFLPLVARP
ncbi:MAG: tandem-95 repeat protein [Herpetosiphonaceae bacterium]|nr:tandem-95 repeat protein [Herpetosiphonaceae bacterium]